MVKREFAELWMKNANLASMEEAKRQVELFIETMKEALEKNEVLVFRGLGTLIITKLNYLFNKIITELNIVFNIAVI